jgi:SagB-type dehydrogenase family enzyme
MNIRYLLYPALIVLLLTVGCASPEAPSSLEAVPATAAPAGIITLPAPRLSGGVSLEETLLKRRSVREYASLALTPEEVSQLLWSAQGITAEWGARTAPSAGALYPLEVYLVVGNVEDVAAGVYKYRPEKHELVKVRDGDVREELTEAALRQGCVRNGAIDIVMAAVYERTTKKYGERGIRYVHMEAGHAAQNICLQATALNLGAVTVGAFYDEKVKLILSLPEDEVPLYIIPVGKKP